MKPIRHLFWDFDGTLYDSYPNVTRAFLRTLDELGCSGLVTPHEALSLLKVSVFSAAQHCAGMAGLDVACVMEVFPAITRRKAVLFPMPVLANACGRFGRQAFATTSTRTATVAPWSSLSRTACGPCFPTA